MMTFLTEKNKNKFDQKKKNKNKGSRSACGTVDTTAQINLPLPILPSLACVSMTHQKKKKKKKPKKDLKTSLFHLLLQVDLFLPTTSKYYIAFRLGSPPLRTSSKAIEGLNHFPFFFFKAFPSFKLKLKNALKNDKCYLYL